MKTDVIVVNSRGKAMGKALEQVDTVASYKRLSQKQALQLRLLAEEMLGLMRSITGETDGNFWIEDENGVYQLHLQVFTRMSSVKREQLLSTATSGKNAAARGLMGKLRDLFERDADSDVAPFTNPLMMDGLYDTGAAAVASADYEWSMSRYREELSEKQSQHISDVDEAWDELEKSVVANVADEIKVYIRGDQVEMVIFKTLG